MVNIIKPGQIVRTKIIYKDTCPRCGCIFEFDDEYVYERERRLNGSTSYYCPYCNFKVTKRLADLDSTTEYTYDSIDEVKGE